LNVGGGSSGTVGYGSKQSTRGDLVASYGNAEAKIINSGTGSFAVAKGKKGHAGAYTDGRNIRLEASGNGRAGVDGGLAWAQAGNGNVAVSFSNAAQEKYRALPAAERQSGKTCKCEDVRCRKNNCRCPCHLVRQNLLGY
jgi:hypothetical protein